MDTKSQKRPPDFSGGLEFTGAIGQSRTDDPLLRRQMLYPTELQPQFNVLSYYINNLFTLQGLDTLQYSHASYTSIHFCDSLPFPTASKSRQASRKYPPKIMNVASKRTQTKSNTILNNAP